MARGDLRGSEGARGGGESNDHRYKNWNGSDGVILGGVRNIYSWVEVLMFDMIAFPIYFILGYLVVKIFNNLCGYFNYNDFFLSANKNLSKA